jgi:acetolactate synthase-1/2/3 large subunit
MQELATVLHHKIPLKLILINNSGYSMIQQTQDQWLSSNYVASSQKGGLSFPDYSLIADAYSMKYFILEENKNLKKRLKEFLNHEGACFLDLKIPSEARVSPQVKFGRPNEDMEPLLERELFLKNMIVEPLSISKD